MVLFTNVNVNQRVEVNLGWGDIRGTVQYKGPISGQEGDWVGVHLDDRVGNCDGMVNGRRYFQCPASFGLFVRANRLRFIPIQRCLYNKYHKVSTSSFVDERLFGEASKPEVTNGPYDPIKISAKLHNRITSHSGSVDDMEVHGRHYHPLKHLISNTRPAVTMKRPRSVTLTYNSRPVHSEYDPEYNFISSPSIPKTHMPYSALRRQVKRGWEDTHYVREMSVPIGRDSMKMSQWNDISA